MDIKERLDIMVDGGVLSEDCRKEVERTISMCGSKFGIRFDEESGAPFITHFCIALERARSGEAVERMPEALWNETKGEDMFAKAWEICLAIKEIVPGLPEAELEYLAVHLGVMLQNRIGG